MVLAAAIFKLAQRRVLDPSDPHESSAVLDRSALAVSAQHETADAAAVALPVGHLGHHHGDLRDPAVRRLQLATAQCAARDDMHSSQTFLDSHFVYSR